MYLLTLLLPFLVGSCLLLGLLAARLPRRRPRLEIHPRHRRFLRRLGLTAVEDFLGLSEVIVSGHPDRRVSRVTLGSGEEQVSAFLKREHRVPWSARLSSALAGFGFLSRSLREARTLQALEREGLGGPEWLAAGEDGRGRAFLLVREVPGALDLGTFLRDHNDPALRRRLARALGQALARLHNVGFAHPDLYAKHVLVGPGAGSIRVLDWQRSVRRQSLGWRTRCRDLAALHATLADDLATPRERLICLHAYLASDRCESPPRRQSLRFVLGKVLARARRLLSRRHIREKRQPLPPAEPQAWVCLDGEALCVTPALRRLCPERVPDVLTLDRPPSPLVRRWLPLGRARTLLVRRSQRALGALWAWLRQRPLESPEQRQAALLLRLERHAIPAPRVLALGQRRRLPWHVESFLLTEPVPDTVRLDVWLRRHARRAPRSARGQVRAVLHQAGTLLGRLHDAGCHLDTRAGRCPLAVRFAGQGPVLVLDSVEAVHARRRRHPGLARRDLRRMRQAFAAAGCGRADLRRFLDAYHPPTPIPAGRPAPPRPRAPAPRPLRPDGETLWHRLVRGVRRFRQRADWAGYAGPGWWDRIMGLVVRDRFQAKQGRSTARLVLPGPAGGGQLTVYLKRHYHLPWWRRVLATLRPGGGWSPAVREWEQLVWARRQGLPVPEVVAAGEYIGPWLRLRSFLAVEELAGMLPLNEAIPLAARRLDPDAFRRWKRSLAAEMARLARLLHDRRHFHKDLYLCHFYVAEEDTARVAADFRGRVFLIDLHRLAHHPWTWRLWQMKDLAQLLYSSEIAGLDVRDRLHFWREYHGRGPGRWLRWGILLKWRRYRSHNARNRVPRAASAERA